MRAAFKAVMDGKVAFLAPTTVLAFQHLKTLRSASRASRCGSTGRRFRSKAEIKQTLADLADGKVEVIVGTHRLLSRTCSSRTSACWSPMRSSGSAWCTRSASSRCATRSTS